jgi:hypothetical protein
MGKVNRLFVPRLAEQYFRTIAAVLKCSRAAIAPLTALMLVPISGAIAYSVEVGSWQYMQRSMQNAADSAALAAATNNQTTGVSNYLLEGKAAARKFSFVNGVGNTTVNIYPPTDPLAQCPPGTPVGPSGTAICYAAKISTKLPLSFSRVIGFNGDTTYGSGRGQTITAYAIASAAGGGIRYTMGCYYAMSTDPAALTGHGIPFANLTGCSVFSNGGIDCTGHDMGADYALSASSTARPDCASTPAGNEYGVTLPPVPYGQAPYVANAANAADPASTPCTSNPPTQGDVTQTLLVYCGGLTLPKNQTLNFTSKNTVIVIRDGTLDLNGGTLQTSSTGTATIIFSGTQPPFAGATMKGTINIQAPIPGDSSSWQGVAMYRAPGGTNISATLAGSQATWDITGAVYFPQVNVTIDGVVNKSTNGPTCFILYADIITINGNGTILNSTSGCTSAGVSPPLAAAGTRAKLVQ